MWSFFLLRHDCRNGEQGTGFAYYGRDGRMKESFTLKENRDFRRLYNRGKSYVSPVVVTYICKNRNQNVRYGITTSKKIGKAVQRNRSRRVIRAAFSQLLPQVKNGYDFVFVARTKTPYVKSTEILRCLKKQLKEAGVLQ